jgi:hypothetical protein
MKTKRDYSIASIVIVLGLALLIPAAVSDTFSQHIVGQAWIAGTILLILAGLLKIEQIEINEKALTKTSFIFKRTVNLSSIKKYKVEAVDMNSFPQYNIASVLKIFKNAQRYSNFRFLRVYPEGKRAMKIDERTMSTSDFKKVLNAIKREKAPNNVYDS